jgi:phosphoglycerate-specific signal transduction histidine kinase
MLASSALRQRLNNIVSQLRKKLGDDAAKYVRIITEQTTTSVIMCVSDDGPGITVEKREEIFKPFNRGKNHSEQKGYGMGLAIVARIALWHGAQVVISQSDELGGTKFIVTFKRHNNQSLNFLNKFRLQLHSTYTINFTINIMIAINQTNIFHFSTHFDHSRRPFDFKVFDNSNSVTIV